MTRTVITGSGCCLPSEIRSNADFLYQDFFTDKREPIQGNTEDIIAKFQTITGIGERRYVGPELNASDIGAIAASQALEDSGTDPETIDQLIVAHNFGDVGHQSNQSDAVPSLASRIKNKLGIKTPACIAYDLIFGCPGWIQGMIQADAFFKAGISRKALVIGTETLSRVIDPFDRDSMIFSDGAGAIVLEKQESIGTSGILGFSMQTHAGPELAYINMGSSFGCLAGQETQFIKMKGRKVYEYAITHVPAAIQTCLESSGVDISEVRKIFIHQANEKLDEAIISRLFRRYGIEEPPHGIMPMSIQWLGNSSVATVPTLFDLVRKNKLGSHTIASGDVIIFASVGAGMNINAVCYRC